MNRIDLAFQGSQKLLSIYFSAGYPNLDDTITIIKALQSSGVDMIEIGLPLAIHLLMVQLFKKALPKLLEMA